MTSADLVATLTELADVLQNQRTLGAALAGIAEAATVSVPRCDAASIAISIEGRPATAATTARVALELDLVQYDTDEGPCLRSFDSLSTVRFDLTGADERFPHFAIAARRAGIRSILSVAATRGGEVVGTLNLYSRSGPFDETAATIATVLSAQVAIAIGRSPEYGAARAVAEVAQRLTDDDAHLNIATGLLVINEECTVEQAEGLLRDAAAHEQTTIVEIGRRIIEQHRSPR